MSSHHEYEALPFTIVDNYRDPSDHAKALRLWNGIALGVLGSGSLGVAAALSSRIWETSELSDVGTGLGIASLGCAAITGIVIDKFENLTRTSLKSDPKE